MNDGTSKRAPIGDGRVQGIKTVKAARAVTYLLQDFRLTLYRPCGLFKSTATLLKSIRSSKFILSMAQDPVFAVYGYVAAAGIVTGADTFRTQVSA